MESKQERILIVEDELAIAEGLVDVFEFQGYQTKHTVSGKEGLELALSNEYDMVLLDLMLPDMDGFNVCNEIRKVNLELPVIILTAKTSEADIIEGLSLGADDYISKPFSVKQLTARVAAVLRRSRLHDGEGVKIHLGTMLVDFKACTGVREDEETPFTRREIDILEYLFHNNTRTISRKELLEKVWGYENADALNTRTVDIHITKLRRKIELDPSNPKYLLTERGVGYQLVYETKN